MTKTDKEGLDIENGLYKVTGLVNVHKVFKRPVNKRNQKTNLVPKPIGYRLLNLKTGVETLVEKEEGVGIISNYGAVNAYIVRKNDSVVDKKTNEVIQYSESYFLKPFPPVAEAFSKDERIVNVYKYDDIGNIQINPIVLEVTEEQCTERLWNIIQADYKQKEQKAKTKRKREQMKPKVDVRTAAELNKAFAKFKSKHQKQV